MEKDKNIGNQDVLFEDIVKGKAKLRKPIKIIIPLVAIVSVGLISLSLFNNEDTNNQLSENVNEINKVINTNDNKLLTKTNTDYLDEMIKDLQEDMTDEKIKKREIELSKQIEKEVDLYSGNDVIEGGESKIKTINIETDSISKAFNEINKVETIETNDVSVTKPSHSLPTPSVLKQKNSLNCSLESNEKFICKYYNTPYKQKQVYKFIWSSDKYPNDNRYRTIETITEVGMIYDYRTPATRSGEWTVTILRNGEKEFEKNVFIPEITIH